MILLSAISAVRDGHGLVALWRIVSLFTLSDLFSSSVSLLAVFGMRRPLCQRQQTPGFLLFVVHYQC